MVVETENVADGAAEVEVEDTLKDAAPVVVAAVNDDVPEEVVDDCVAVA